MDVEVLANPERVAMVDFRRGAFRTGLIAVAWVALALWRPTVTYHLAPFLVAGAWPYFLRNGPLRVANIDAIRAAIAGFGATMVTALVLVFTDAMRGPTLWETGHAMLEVVPIALVGAATGYRLARCGVAIDP